MANMIAFDIGVVRLSEYNANGFLGLQADAYGEDLAGVEAIEAHGMCGELARPMDPDVGSDGQPIESKACQVLIGQEGGRSHAFCLNDPRTLSKLPAMQKGEKLVFAPNLIAQFIRFHASGAISIYTTDDGTVNGKTISRTLSPDPLQGIVDFCPWGSVKLNSTGYHVMTSGGARCDGGGMSGPGLPSSVGSYWEFQAATFGATCSAVTLGPTPDTALPVAIATPLLAYLAALEPILVSLATGAGVVGSSATLTPAVAAFVSAVAALKLKISSSSTNSN